MSDDQYFIYRTGNGRFLLQNIDTGMIAGLVLAGLPGESARAFSYDFGSVWYPEQIINLHEMPELAEMPFFSIEMINTLDVANFLHREDNLDIHPILATYGKFLGYGLTPPANTEITFTEPQWCYEFVNPNGSWRIPIHDVCVTEAGCFFVNRDGWITGLNHTGELIQQYKLDHLTRCLTSFQDSLYVTCDDGCLYEISGKIPEAVYQVKPADTYYYQYFLFALLGDRQHIFVTDAYGNLLCLDPEFKLVWQQQYSRCWLSFTLCATSDRLYQGYYDGVVCYDRATGQSLWEALTPAPVICGCLTSSHFIVACGDRHLYAFKQSLQQDPQDHERELFCCLPTIPTAIAYAESFQCLIVSDGYGRIFCIDLQGNIQQTLWLKSGAANCLALWQDQLYVGTSSSFIYCFDLNQYLAKSTLPSLTKQQGILVQCIRKGKQLKICPIDLNYRNDWHVYFRHPRQEGAQYWVEQLKIAKQGNFYLASGKITPHPSSNTII